MEPFTSQSSMLGGSDLNAGIVNSSLLNDINLQRFPDDIQMDMGDISAVPFHSVEPLAGSLSESEQQHESAALTDAEISNDILNNGDNDHSGTNGVNNSSVGAGPLPTGFGTQSGTGSTLTEFTKRRNWSQRVIEELKDLLYILTPDARFLYLSPSLKTLMGYEPRELLGTFIHDVIHPDDSSLFLREFNESIATGNALRMYYRLRTKEEKYLIFECHGHPHLTNDVSHLEMTGGPRNNAGFCAGFFMMARPYPTKNAELLDSFLEHKIENERLQARIAALKREEANEAENSSRNFHKKPAGSATPSQSAEPITGAESPSVASRADGSEFGTMPPPAKPTVSNMALTREALDEANASARPDSITDKMARYEGASHVDSIEMFTGLRYREGERSQGISTGGTSPALVRGDAGIDIPMDKTDSRHGGAYLDKKPKKMKSADEYVCTDCGTLDSPEWRKGPNGPKTLCNACGLRWAKKEKRRGGNSCISHDGGMTGYSDSKASIVSESTIQQAMSQHSTVPNLKHSNSTGSAS